jgi:hypothetical protein
LAADRQQRRTRGGLVALQRRLLDLGLAEGEAGQVPLRAADVTDLEPLGGQRVEALHQREPLASEFRLALRQRSGRPGGQPACRDVAPQERIARLAGVQLRRALARTGPALAGKIQRQADAGGTPIHVGVLGGQIERGVVQRLRGRLRSRPGGIELGTRGLHLGTGVPDAAYRHL